MSTILCDVAHGILGADSCQADGDLRMTCTKIRQLPGIGLVAWAGRHSDGLVWVEWVEAGMLRADRPTHLTELNALLLHEDGTLLHFEDRCLGLPVETPTYAIGSGREIALTAMRCGKTVLEALQIAAEMDLYTAAPFVVYQRQERGTIVPLIPDSAIGSLYGVTEYGGITQHGLVHWPSHHGGPVPLHPGST